MSSEIEKLRGELIVKRLQCGNYKVKDVAKRVGRSPALIYSYRNGNAQLPWYMQPVIEEALDRIDAGLPVEKQVGERADGTIDHEVVKRLEEKLKQYAN